MLGKLTSEGTLSADEHPSHALRRCLAPADRGRAAVSFAFNTTDRLANAFAFEVLSQEGFEAGAKYLQAGLPIVSGVAPMRKTTFAGVRD